jgi:hypothetical protein
MPHRPNNNQQSHSITSYKILILIATNDLLSHYAPDSVAAAYVLMLIRGPPVLHTASLGDDRESHPPKDSRSI